MNLKVRTARIGLTSQLHDLIERRVHYALSRFSPQVSRVSVLIEDVNGVRGGVDKRCEIAVLIKRGGELRAAATDAVIEPAIAMAADRIGRAVQRKLELRREVRRASATSDRTLREYDGAPQDS